MTVETGEKENREHDVAPRDEGEKRIDSPSPVSCEPCERSTAWLSFDDTVATARDDECDDDDEEDLEAEGRAHA